MEYIHYHAPSATLSVAAQRVITYCQNHHLAAMENGQHLIDGEDFFVNIFTYHTQLAAARIWEAHRAYIDVHTIITGSEVVCHNFIEDCKTGIYHPDRDYLEVMPSANTSFTLCPDYFAVFYPQDAHQTGVRRADQPSQSVRKAVFKIRI